MEGNELYRSHILEAIEKINRYLNGLTFEDFIKNELIQDAIVRQLEIIGEASKNFSDEFKKKHFVLPWNQIAGMRDKLIHGYFGVDVEVVWKTVKEDLPVLKVNL